jgi:murein DD-endopeptidase MepM/ murein hydrolase activator NlpD
LLLRQPLIQTGCLALIAIPAAAITSTYGSAAARSRAKATTQVRRSQFIPTAVRSDEGRCVSQRRLEMVTGDGSRLALAAPSTTIRLVKPSRETPSLRQRGYVFPVLGPMRVFDTFGAPRAQVAWHHGDDLFATRGTPVLAVANGWVFSVGWQRLGGRRLWLRDQSGNEFYYAHLDKYSRLARNGLFAHTGDVLGFVGNSGDAELTPPHLHFEIHPASLLHLGYDGAVDPTTYLTHWNHVLRLKPNPAFSCAPSSTSEEVARPRGPCHRGCRGSEAIDTHP